MKNVKKGRVMIQHQEERALQALEKQSFLLTRMLPSEPLSDS